MVQATLFTQTREYVLKRMESLLRDGECKLPTERELAEEIFASYATLRLVMKQLENEGFIRKIRGSGTYIEPQAAELLQQEKRPRVRLFHPPYQGDEQSAFGPFFIATLHRAAEESNCQLVAAHVHDHREFIHRLEAERNNDTPIIYLPPNVPFTMEELGRLARYASFPLIVLDNELPHVQIDSLGCDNRSGGMLAAGHLLRNGHSRIAILLSEPRLPQIMARIRGFRDSLALAGLEPELIDCGVLSNEESQEKIVRTLSQRLDRGLDFTALFALSDSGAFKALEVLKQRGIRIGHDISLISFDGVPATRTLEPSLCCVVQPVEEICRQAFELLKHPEQHGQQLFAPTLRAGGSVRKLGQLQLEVL